MNINSTQQIEESTQSQGNFIEIKDGGKVTLRIVSGIKGVKEHNVDIKGKRRAVMCPVEMERWEAASEDREVNKGIRCPVCETGNHKVTTQFLAIALDEKGQPGVLKKGATVFKPITELQEAGYTLSETQIIISRKGTGLDTEYSVIPSKNDKPMTEEEKAIVAAFEQEYNLEQRSKPMSYENIERKLKGEDLVFDDEKGDDKPLPF